MPALPLPGFVRRLIAQIVDDEVPDLAAGLAYRFLFALFPFAIFLAALAAFAAPAMGLGDPTGTILGGLSDNLPPDIANELRPQLEVVLGTTRPGLLSIGAAVALWAAASGIGSVIAAMNKAYDVRETRGFLHRTGLALGITLLGSVGILLAFVTIIGGSVITAEVASRLGLDSTTWSVIALLRFPLVLVVVSLAVAMLFKLGPNVSISVRWAIAGGAVFAVGWVVGTVLFGLYVANFGNYSNTYGALGGVVILLLWFYLTGLLLLIAAEVTSMLAREREPQVIEARRGEIEAQAKPEGPSQAKPEGLGRRSPKVRARRLSRMPRAARLRSASAPPGDRPPGPHSDHKEEGRAREPRRGPRPQPSPLVRSRGLARRVAHEGRGPRGRPRPAVCRLALRALALATASA